MKKLSICGLFLMMLTFFTGCKEESIVLTSELPQFELREGLMLIEGIVPYGTGINDQIYIYGAFNGGEDAIGNPEWLLQRGNPQSGVPAKFGIYLNPNSFVDGKTLADGYSFYNIQSGAEVDLEGNIVWHYDYPAVGQRLNVFIDYWEGSLSEPENPDDVDHDGYAIYILNNSSWADLYLWAWPEGAGGEDFLGVSWPGIPATGKINIGGSMYTYFDTGADHEGETINIIISNNGSPQTDTYPDVVLDRDHYFELTSEGALVELDPDASVSHDGYAVFIYNNNPDFEELYAWVWEEGSGGEDFLGVGWPGVPFTGTQMINGVAYEYFDFGAANDGKTVNFIVNNNNQGKQAEVDGLVLDKNYYYELVGTTLTAIDPDDFQPGGETPNEPEVPSEPLPTMEYKIYLVNNTGWDALYLYAWGSQDTDQVFGGWPGTASTVTRTIDGVSYLVYTMEASGQELNLIFNNGKEEDEKVQFDGPVITGDKDYYISVSATSYELLDYPTFNIYVENKTEWTEFALYGYGSAGNSFFGDWPGVKASDTETVNGVTYYVFPYEGTGQSEMLIFNNNNNGEQLDDFEVILNQDYYLTITPEGVKNNE